LIVGGDFNIYSNNSSSKFSKLYVMMRAVDAKINEKNKKKLIRIRIMLQ